MNVHTGCGGTIINRTCTKCGRTWGRIRYLVSQEIEPKSTKFDPDAYRKRIRRGDDLKRR